MKEQEVITYEEVKERLRNKKLEEYTPQDLFDRYIAYGSEEELQDSKIQRLLIKNGYAKELLEVAPHIDNEVMEEIFKTIDDTPLINNMNNKQAKSEDTTIWDLADSIEEKKIGKALQVLEELINQNEPPLKLLKTIKFNLERVYMCKVAILQQKDIATVLALKPNQKFLISKYVEHSNNFTQEELERILKALESLKELYLNNIGKFDLKTGLRNIINNLEIPKVPVPISNANNSIDENIDIITGYEDIDKLINIKPHTKDKLVIIGGTNETDRTTLALNIAKNILEQDKAVLYFSLGVSMETIKNNNIISNIDNLVVRSFDERGAEILCQRTTDNCTKRLYINDTPRLPIESIERISYKAKLENNIKMIIIDYLQLVKRIRTDNFMNSEHTQEEIILLLKQLSYNFNIPIILLSQISEETDTRGKPTLQDFPISKQLQDNIDIIISTYRDNNNKDIENVELLLLNERAKEYKHITDFGDIIDRVIHKPLKELSAQDLHDRYILYRYK